MEALKKRQLKRKVRIFNTISFVLVGVFFLLITLMIVSNDLFGAPLGEVISPVIAIAVLIVTLFTPLVLVTYSSVYRGQLIQYKNGIRAYRERKVYQQIMDMLLTGDLTGAVKLYNQYKFESSRQMADALYCVLITELKNSSDPESRNKGMNKLEKLRNHFALGNVVLF
jgi:hypothetical protein